jgi:hypothetical protein
MLQWLYTYVNSLSSMFHLFFIRMLQSCLFGCYICSHTYVVSVFQVFFVSVSDASIKCFIFLFLMLHSNVFKSISGGSRGIRVGSWRGRERSPRASNIRLTRAHAWTRENVLRPTPERLSTSSSAILGPNTPLPTTASRATRRPPRCQQRSFFLPAQAATCHRR